MDRIYPKHTEKEGETFPDLRTLADEIVANGWFMFTRVKRLIEGKNSDPMKESSGEPKQEPDLSMLDDDIPF